MTYNTPILMNVDTAFNVVLGVNWVVNADHITEKADCATTDSTAGSSDDNPCV